MKQTTTEIFIEVEEITQVKFTARKKSLAEETKNSKPVIEICPHCHQAIFEQQIIELEGDLNI